MSLAPPRDLTERKRFSMADQEAFAALSADRNPIHLDQIASRRTLAGAAVVHGVHGLLWALEQAAHHRPLTGLRTIAARFNRFAYVDAEVAVRLIPRGEALTVELIADGQAVTTVKLEWGEPLAAVLTDRLPAVAAEPLPPVPDAPSFEAMQSLGGRVSWPDDTLAERMFPAVSAAIGPAAVSAVAAASGVVGMACPGLHSLFSQLTLRRIADPAPAPGLGWRTARTDARAGWVVLDVAGAGWEGEIICMERQPPVAPQSMEELSRRVGPEEFKGVTALIVGGSRGLGAVTGKLLAAGGGRVILTYARGIQEAEDLAREIRTARGEAACAIRHCDVKGDVAAQLAGLELGISHLYYFATPRIASQKASLCDRQLLDDFLTVYVDGFLAVWKAVAVNRPLSVLYPSTIFLDSRPKGMTEYVMAKAAGEVLCADLARRFTDVSVQAPRIPRVLTDQTATSPPTPAADPVEVMLPLLRSQPKG